MFRAWLVVRVLQGDLISKLMRLIKYALLSVHPPCLNQVAFKKITLGFK